MNLLDYNSYSERSKIFNFFLQKGLPVVERVFQYPTYYSRPIYKANCVEIQYYYLEPHKYKCFLPKNILMAFGGHRALIQYLRDIYPYRKFNVNLNKEYWTYKIIITF